MRHPEQRLMPIIASLILAVAVGLVLGCGAPSETTAPASVGSEALIGAPNLDTVYLAIDKESFDMWTKACVAKDYIGMAQLEATGRVFAVPNGTKVLVINSSSAARKVRVLEGESFGMSGWLPYEWLK